jgi:hypothetical protein
VKICLIYYEGVGEMRKAYRIVEGKSGGKRPVMRSYEIEV